ncbi:MAG: hypothetical protein H6Q75_749 [Firmicutes bacterium]|nr:hypothetical protein [Bacillota bacterium]
MLLVSSGIARAEDNVVRQVVVSVKTNDSVLPARVQKRMELSVETVGQQVLIGRSLTELGTKREVFEHTIKDIFDRVLVGYSVASVRITPDSRTQLEVTLAPWGDVVRDVKLDIDYSDMSLAAVSLIQQDLGNLAENIRSILVGMPVDSVDWSSGVTKSVIRETLSAQLPEFRANIEILSGQVTTVKLVLLPAGPKVQNVRVSIRSQSIPNILLMEARPPVEKAAQMLRGVPVAFVERHGDYFKQKLLASLIGSPVVNRYGLNLSLAMMPGPDTEIDISAGTKLYKVTLEGLLDIGRKEDNTAAILHIGKYVAKQHEFFVETTFVPSTVSWKIAPGWSYHTSPYCEGGIKYDFSNQSSVLWLKQDLSKNILLRLERTTVSHNNELGLRYKLHEFLSAEYVITNDAKWLRLVGNL